MEVILAAMIVFAVAIQDKLDSLGEAYASACTAIGGEYHAPDEYYPYNWHCFPDE